MPPTTIQLLPNEVILCIAAEVDSPRDLSALSRVNRRFHHTLDDFLYLQSALRWGNPALLWGAELGKIATVNKALGAGADINAKGSPPRESRIPRDCECYWDNHKTDPCNDCCKYSTPLMLAIDSGHYEMVKYLLTIEGRDITSKDASDFYPLHAAVFLGDIAMVKLLLEQKDVNPELSGYDMETPLITAVENRHVDLVKLLLGHPNVDPSTGNECAKMPMFWVVWYRDGEIAKLLLDAGASPNSHFGVCPLELAVDRGCADVVRHLLDAGAVPESTSPAAILLGAVTNNYLGVVRVILEHFTEIDINFKNRFGKTALWYAASDGKEEMVSLLLSRNGIEVNGSYADGFSESTVLIVAAMQGDLNIVKMLVDVEGIELDAVNGYGKTAMEAACAKGHYETAEFIRAAMEAKSTQERTSHSFSA